MKSQIDDFRGNYAFLSNFYECEVLYKGNKFRSTEAAFQAHKSFDPNVWLLFEKLNPSKAKMFGRRMVLSDKEIQEWNIRRLQVMEDVVYAKFINNRILMAKLQATGNVELIEGNTWGDTFWGVCRGKGENHLGKILMEVRNYGKSV